MALHLDRVEAFAVDAADGALRDEGLAVDHLNEAEDVCPLAVAGHEHDHLDRLVRIAALALEDGAAALQTVDDGVSDLVVFAGEDHELHRLCVGVHHAVEHVGVDAHLDESEHDLIHVGKEEVGAADDQEVEQHHAHADGDVLVLVDDGHDDVRSARAAASVEDEPQARAADHGADDDGHEDFLQLHEGLAGEHKLEEPEPERERDDAKDGLDEEFEPEDLEGDAKQDDVDREIGDGDRQFGGEEDQSADTA